MSFPDLGLNETVFFIVRIIAAVGGAVVGWFGSDPLTRLAYRLWTRTPTPGVLLAVMKTGTALSLSLLIYFYLPLGGGRGGFRIGPGNGHNSDKGPDKGGSKTDRDPKIDKGDRPSTPTKSIQGLQPVEIEIISVNRFKDDDRFFIVDHKGPALSLGELDEYLIRNGARIEVRPVLTLESIGVGRPNNPLEQLLALTKKHDVKTLTPKSP